MRRLGVDVGGTFTDLIYVDDEGGVHVHKVPSTPADPSTATMQGALELCETGGVGAGRDRPVLPRHDRRDEHHHRAQRRRGRPHHDQGLPGHPPHRAAQEAAQLVELPGPAVAALPARAAPPPDARDRARHRAERGRARAARRGRGARRRSVAEGRRSRVDRGLLPLLLPQRRARAGGRRRSCSRSFPRRSSPSGTRSCRSTASTRASRRSA